MTLRGRFVVVFVSFSLVVTAAVGYVAWRIARDALEAELDQRLEWVAGAAAETGLQSSLVAALEPGDEDSPAWNAAHARLARLRRYVAAAYIVDSENRALVTSAPADSIPTGTVMQQFRPYDEELAEARLDGAATSPHFYVDGRFYKYGFVELEQSDLVLAVLVQADFPAPVAALGRTLVLASLFAALLAGGLGFVLAAGVVEPLERLSRVALRIQRGYMDEPVEGERSDELGRLARAMERMREGILERDEQLRLMLAQVAHEIRNPLGGLELFASAAADSDDPVERRRLLARIRAEVRTLNRIIDDFLTYARPLQPDPVITDVRGALEEAMDLARGDAARTGAVLEANLPSEPLTARVDPDHVKRVVLNLLRNAAQAGSLVRLSAEWQHGEVVVTVQDDGPGVPEAMRERIFEPFVTDKQQGAGLGLAIVRKVVEGAGGRVEVDASADDTFGTGAAFRVYFPGSEDLPAAERPVPPRPALAE